MMADHSKLKTQSSELIFIHGAGSNADFWHEQRKPFSAAHYVNLPGHFNIQRRAETTQASSPIPQSAIPRAQRGAQLIEAYTNWVEEYIQGLDLDGVILNGHSMGGAIALTLALRGPEWLRGIILTATGARLPILPRLLELLRSDYPAAVDLIIELSFAPALEPLTYAQRIRRNGVRRQLLRTPQEVTLADYEACNRFDVTPRANGIRLPTLCIVGAQDRMTPPNYSEYLHGQIRGSQLEIIEGAGHMLPLERSEEYNLRIRKFVGSLGDGPGS